MSEDAGGQNEVSPENLDGAIAEEGKEEGNRVVEKANLALDPDIAPMATIDAQALLVVLREVEMKLIQFGEREDEVPAWAGSIMPRLANLERVLARYGANVGKVPGGKEPKSLASIDHKEIENKILDAVRKETAAEINTAKYLLDGKIEGAVREMERLQLLLKTRPNVKDLHKVQEVVTDLGVDVRKTLTATTQRVDGIVKNTVENEMEVMTGRIAQSEKSLDASFNIANKKVAAFNASLKEFEQGINDTNKGMNAKLDAQQATTNLVAETLEQFRKEHEEERTRLDQAIADVMGSMEAASAVFTDYRSKNALRIGKLEEMVAKSDAAQKAHCERTEDRDFELQTGLNTVEAALGDFRKIYESDTAKANEMLDNVQNQLEALQKVQKEHIEYLDECKEVSIIEKALRHEDVLEILKKRSKHHEEDVNQLQGKIISVSSLVESIHTEMKKFPEAVTKCEGNLDRVILEINAAQDNMGSLEDTFKDTRNQVDELYSIREEILAAQNEGEEQGKRVKAVFDQLSSILSKSEEHDKTIEDVFVNLEQGETNIQKTMEELKYNLMETLMSKQAEIEAQVENVKENMEMVMLTQNPLGGMGFKSAGGGGGAGSAGGGRKSVAKAAASTATRNVPGRAPKQAFGRGAVPGRGGAATGGDVGSLQALVMSEDRKQGMVHGTTPGPQGTAHLTNAALRAEFNFNAQFVADLCVSHEDISIRKGMVDQLSPALCENLAGAAQGMAQLICTVVDSEIMQGVLQGLEDETRLETDNVTERRRAKMDVFVKDVIANVNKHNSTPGQLRYDAREVFTKRLIKVLDVCMSKHDQMVVVGNSRLGRTKIPSCIACDRPMLDKVRQGQSSTMLDAGVPPGSLESVASFGAGAPNSMASTGFNVKMPTAK